MKRTFEEIGELVFYERINRMRSLPPPSLKTDDIIELIRCRNFEKTKLKHDQMMERYNRKYAELKEKAESLKKQIGELTTEIGYNTGEIKRPGLGRLLGDTLESTKPFPGQSAIDAKGHNESVRKYNAIIEVVRRLSDKKDALVDKYHEAVEKCNEATDESAKKVEEFEVEALTAIDDDIVAMLDKCTNIAERLANAPNSEDWPVAVEILFIELKLYHMMEQHIGGNAQRKECKERIVEISGLLSTLCSREPVLNHIADSFRRNISLATKNAELHEQARFVVSGIDQEALGAMMRSLAQVLEEKINTVFEYEGTVDPSVLETTINKIKDTIAAIERNISKTTELAASTKALAAAAVSTDKDAKALFGTMKSNLETMSKELITPCYFESEMIEETLIDDFYHKDLRPRVVALRQHIRSTIGEEQMDALLAPNEDRYSIAKTETVIQGAKLTRLQAEREKLDPHVSKLTAMIAGLKSDISKAENVPQANSDAFRKDASTKYFLTCIPFIGVFGAFGILSKVNEFEAAFRSNNRIYKELGIYLLAKNAKMMTAALALAGIVGICGMIIFFALHLSQNAVINALVPGTAGAAYVGTWAFLSQTTKRIQSFKE